MCVSGVRGWRLCRALDRRFKWNPAELAEDEDLAPVVSLENALRLGEAYLLHHELGELVRREVPKGSDHLAITRHKARSNGSIAERPPGIDRIAFQKTLLPPLPRALSAAGAGADRGSVLSESNADLQRFKRG